MNIYDTIQADQIEDGDQIIIDGEALEQVTVLESEDPDEVVIRGYSEDEGDFVRHTLPYDYSVDLWSV